MLKRKKKVIAKVMATTMLATTIATTFGIEANADSLTPRTAVSSSKISGSDRYKTAVEISKNYSSSSKHAVIVNGQKGIVDALTATPYASLKNAPILMTQSNKLNADTKAELTRRGIKTVDIVGGVNSVNDSVKSEIQAMGITVNRIAGSSKYDTALEVAKKIDAISDISKIAVANGEVLADAVSVAAPAAQNEMPIILAHPKNGLDDKTKSYIDNQGVKTSYVIGGTDSVSSTTQNSLPGTKKRLEGSGRQDTNAAVVKEFYTSSSYDNVYVTKSGQVNTQDEIADALAVGVLAAKEQDPVMIVGKSLATSQSNLLKDKKLTKMTEIGNGIPSASINSIKDSQKSPEEIEATVSSVYLVNYNTIKIVGKELDRIDKSKVSISGNTTNSYSVNSSGTEATVEFSNTFTNGTTTVRVTSNLGNTTSHTFTYNSQISSVEGVSSEIGTGANGAIQYVEFTVNGGQKRSVEELKALGWKVEFKSSRPIFYKSSAESDAKSSDGKLRTNIDSGKTTPFEIDQVFDYEVVLTKGTEKISSGLKAIRVVDKTTQYKEIKSFDVKLANDVKINSNKLVVGETANIVDLDVVDINGNTAKLTTADNFTVTSSNSSVVSVNSGSIEKNKLTANSTGSAEISIKNGDVIKKFNITVVADARKASSVSLSKNTVYLTANQNVKIEATIKDQYNDLYKGYTLVGSDHVIKSGEDTVATVKQSSASDKEGKIEILIEAANTDKNLNGNLVIKDDNKTMTTISVYVSKQAPATSWKLENEVGKDNILDLYTPNGKDSDDILNLKLNGYNGSYLVGDEKTIAIHTTGSIPTTGFVVTSTDSKVANIESTTDGTIKVKAVKDGSATIRAYYNGAEKSSISITVKDSTPKITAISTKQIDTRDKVEPTFDAVTSLLNLTELPGNKTIVDGLSISGTTEEVLLGQDADNRCVLYVEKDGEDGYLKDKDLLLATIDVSTDFGAHVEKYRVVNIEAEKSGNIIVKIFKGEYPTASNPSNPFKVEVIKVDTNS